MQIITELIKDGQAGIKYKPVYSYKVNYYSLLNTKVCLSLNSQNPISLQRYTYIHSFLVIFYEFLVSADNHYAFDTFTKKRSYTV